jgi:hypothetical protein
MYLYDSSCIWIAQIQTRHSNEHKSIVPLPTASHDPLPSPLRAAANEYVQVLAKCPVIGPSDMPVVDEHALQQGKMFRLAVPTKTNVAETRFLVYEVDLSPLNNAHATTYGSQLLSLETKTAEHVIALENSFPGGAFFYADYIYFFHDGSVHAHSLENPQASVVFPTVFDWFGRPNLVHDAQNNHLVLQTANREMWFPLQPVPKLRIHPVHAPRTSMSSSLSPQTIPVSSSSSSSASTNATTPLGSKG